MYKSMKDVATLAIGLLRHHDIITKEELKEAMNDEDAELETMVRLLQRKIDEVKYADKQTK